MEEQYYLSIKEKLLKSEIYDKTKDYAKDRNKVKAYYETGELLSKIGKDYGKNIIKQYSEKLMIEVGKKYNERNLRYMRQFYELFISIKWNPIGSKLNWSHYRELLVVNDKEYDGVNRNRYVRLNGDNFVSISLHKDSPEKVDLEYKKCVMKIMMMHINLLSLKNHLSF